MPGTPDPALILPGEVMARDFFARPALAVARELLGCVLEHETPEGLVAVVLTEVEAYEGERDPASHAFRGRTGRNAVMFGPPGHAYVYFTYGMHFCVNLVCGPEGVASAVLLRAGRVIAGAALAAARRGAAGPQGRDLARGPARMCQALGIDRSLNGADVCDPASPVRLRSPAGLSSSALAPLDAPVGSPDPSLSHAARDRSAAPSGAQSVGGGGGGAPGGSAGGPPPSQVWHISQGPRVGVSAAGELPWRFWLTGDPTVSAYRPHMPRARRPAARPASPGKSGAPGREEPAAARPGAPFDPPHIDGTMQQ